MVAAASEPLRSVPVPPATAYEGRAARDRQAVPYADTRAFVWPEGGKGKDAPAFRRYRSATAAGVQSRGRGSAKAATPAHSCGGMSRDQVDAIECSSTWADDVWYAHDRDYANGGLTGSGTAKVACGNPDCARRTPPNNVADLLKRRPYQPGRRSRYRIVGRQVCDDCRLAATAPVDRPKRSAWVDGIGPVAAVATTADLERVGVKIIEPKLPAGGRAEPAAPELTDDMTAAERQIVLDDHRRELAAYERDADGMSDALATYYRRIAAEPERWREWVAEFDRTTGS